MNTNHYTNGLGIVYNMYGNIGFFDSREQSLTKPRCKRFGKRKLFKAIKHLLSVLF